MSGLKDLSEHVEELKADTEYEEYELTVDKVFEHGQWIAPEQKLVFAPPDYPKVEYTYTEFGERVNRLGSALEEFELEYARDSYEMGSRVAVVEWNTTRYQELMYAVMMKGATINTINIRLPPEDQLYCLDVSEPEVLFIASDFLPYLDDILKNTETIRTVVTMSNQITCTGDGEAPEIEVPPEVNLYEYEDLLERIGEPQCEWPNLDERVIAGFHFTSGTTGRPKPVYHTHRQLMLGTLQSLAGHSEAPYEGSSRDIPITLTPYFHILGWLAPFQYFCGGNKYIFQEKYEFDHIAKLIKEYLPEAKRLDSRIIAAGVPTMISEIAKELKKLGVTDLEDHLLMNYGGAALPLSLYDELKEMGIQVSTGYGPTETGTTTITRASFTPRMWMKMGWNPEKMMDHYVRNNTLGTLMPFAHGKVVDDDGEELPHDGESVGRFLFRSPTITKEYYENPEKTRESWESGYFDVNDIVTIDEYGSVNFRDRTKDVIKSGGEWVPSSRLENFVSKHSAVSEVAAIGVFHQKWNERPVAIVSLNEGEDAREEDIKNHLMKFVEEGRMPKWWIPDRVIFKDQLPKTATSKIDKQKLKEEYKDLQLED